MNLYQPVLCTIFAGIITALTVGCSGGGGNQDPPPGPQPTIVNITGEFKTTDGFAGTSTIEYHSPLNIDVSAVAPAGYKVSVFVDADGKGSYNDLGGNGTNTFNYHLSTIPIPFAGAWNPTMSISLIKEDDNTTIDSIFSATGCDVAVGDLIYRFTTPSAPYRTVEEMDYDINVIKGSSTASYDLTYDPTKLDQLADILAQEGVLFSGIKQPTKEDNLTVLDALKTFMNNVIIYDIPAIDQFNITLRRGPPDYSWAVYGKDNNKTDAERIMEQLKAIYSVHNTN